MLQPVHTGVVESLHDRTSPRRHARVGRDVRPSRLAGLAMTDREPTPLAPTCPVCASRENVERQRPFGWLCGTCWTVFSGAQGEWEKNRDRRDRWAAARARTDA